MVASGAKFPRSMSMSERVFASITKVDMGYATECWIWQRAKQGAGYGHLWSPMLRRTQLAHRVSYESANGPISDGLTLDHRCRNRACCNPDHLDPVTMAVNLMRGEGPSAINARKTMCPQGHSYDDEKNCRTNKSGGRHCRACQRIRASKIRAKKRIAEDLT